MTPESATSATSPPAAGTVAVVPRDDLPDVPVDDTPPAELDTTPPSGQLVDVPLWPSAASTSAATVERALAFLADQVGLAEYPPGSNINWITDWYYGWHAPWCAMTVSRALIEAGFGGPEQIDIPVRTTSARGWAYCPYLEADFRAAYRWQGVDTAAPEPGDLVLYDWDGDGEADHVGMLERVELDGTLWVYEGNTDEGVLRLKHRSLTYVRGFARPPYSPAAPVPTPTPEEPSVAKVAYPLSVAAGERRRLPVLAIGGGFGWTRASVTFASLGVTVRRAIVGPNERPIAGLAPEGVESAREFGGRGYVDLVAGDEWVEIVLAGTGGGTLDLAVEASDA